MKNQRKEGVVDSKQTLEINQLEKNIIQQSKNTEWSSSTTCLHSKYLNDELKSLFPYKNAEMSYLKGLKQIHRCIILLPGSHTCKYHIFPTIIKLDPNNTPNQLILLLLMSIKPNSPSKSEKSNTLTEDFIYSILGQEDVYRKQKNKANLTKLIQLYRKLVEFYSERNDKISIYFMDKISQLSSEIPLLQQPEEKLTMSMARQVIEEDNPVDSRFKNIITTPATKYDPEQKKKERSKNAQIAIEVSKIKKRTNARTILKSYYEECLENNNLVNADLQQQRKQLEQKLMAIHKKSMEVGNKKIVI